MTDDFVKLLLKGITQFIQWLLENIWLFISEFIKLIVDGLAVILPETPDNLKLAYLISGYVESNDFMSYFFIQIVQGVVGILLIILTYKAIKILPLV